MHPKRISELKKAAAEALESGELTDEAQKKLVRVLTPDAHEQTWPDVEVVLYVAEHSVIATKMQDERLPEILETALVEAFSAVLPLLGARAFGPLQNFADTARRRLDAERRKYEMVAQRLDKLDDEQAVRLLRNYVSTSPAPLFVARFRQQRPKLFGEAERQSAHGVDVEVLVEDRSIAAALRDPASADPDTLAAKLGELAEHPDVSPLTLRRALAGDGADQQLLAAAVAAFGGRADLAPMLLSLVLSGARDAAYIAVMAARLAPLMARQVLSQFLAEAAWQNPEEPEAQITAERTHAILSARCVLPRIGSPLEAVELDDLPENLDDELRPVPDMVDASWALWERLG